MSVRLTQLTSLRAYELGNLKIGKIFQQTFLDSKRIGYVAKQLSERTKYRPTDESQETRDDSYEKLNLSLKP